MQAPKSMLPWITAELEATRALMGSDYWSYGLQPNRAVLDWTLDQMRNDGLIGTPVNAAGPVSIPPFSPRRVREIDNATQLSRGPMAASQPAR